MLQRETAIQASSLAMQSGKASTAVLGMWKQAWPSMQHLGTPITGNCHARPLWGPARWALLRLLTLALWQQVRLSVKRISNVLQSQAIVMQTQRRAMQTGRAQLAVPGAMAARAPAVPAQRKPCYHRLSVWASQGHNCLAEVKLLL